MKRNGLKLKVGDSVLTQEGERHTVERDDGHDKYPFWLSNGLCYTKEGRWLDSDLCKSGADIIQVNGSEIDP